MTLGEQLRAAREAKGVTLEQAADATKVKPDILRALESDDYSRMPAPVYAKGFLKMYAQYLGLDPSTARAQYEQLTGKPVASAVPPASFPKAAARLGQTPLDRLISSMATMWGMWLLVAGIVLVLILIVWVVISATRRAQPGTGGAPDLRPARPAAVAPQWARQPARAATNIPPTSPDAYIRPTPPKPGVLEPMRTNAPGAVSPAAISKAPATAPVILSVRLTQDSWIKVVLDDKTELAYRTQRAGWSNEWRAHSSIRLIAGNAAGVQARLNGQEVPPLGRKGQIADETFTR